METSFIGKVITFLSNHFEIIIYVNCSLAGLFLLGYFGVKFSDEATRKLYGGRIKNVLISAVILGQIVFLGVSVFLYWKNYKVTAPQIPTIGDALPTTYWVHDDVRVYFIDQNHLRSIKINGKDLKDVFSADSAIKQYIFSPDGKYIAIVSENQIYLVNRLTKGSESIDQLFSDEQLKKKRSGSIEGSIGNIQWSPDSQKFVYEMARWSKFATQDQIYIYSVVNRDKKSIRSPTRKISSLYWGKSDGHLYFIQHEAQDTSENGDAFKVRVFRIPLTTLTPEFVTHIPFESFSIPIENLNLRDIQLYFDGAKFSFGPSFTKNHAVSENGSIIGIDEEDYLYVVNSKWFRKRLYSIPRDIDDVDAYRYHHKGGDLIIDDIQWVPGGRYVIMEHKYWGVVILEPSTGKIGLLIQANGRSFGWHPLNND